MKLNSSPGGAQEIGAIILRVDLSDTTEELERELSKGGLLPDETRVVDLEMQMGSFDSTRARICGTTSRPSRTFESLAEAINICVKELNTPFVLVQTSDIMCDSSTLEGLRSAIRRENGIAVVGMDVLNPGRKGIAVRFPSEQAHRGTKHLLRVLRGSQNGNHSGVIFMIVNRDSFLRADGWNADLGVSAGAFELLRRLITFGYRVDRHDGARAYLRDSEKLGVNRAPALALSELQQYVTLLRGLNYRKYIWIRRASHAATLLYSFARHLRNSEPSDDGLREKWRWILRLSDESRQLQGNGISANPRVSVIIPTKDRNPSLARVLSSLSGQSYPASEVIIVDQSISPVIVPEVKDLPESCKVKVVRLLTSNRSHAKNFGTAAASGDLLLFLDDDVEIQPDLIEVHVRAYRDKRIGGVTCRMIEEGRRSFATSRVLRNTWYGHTIGRQNSTAEGFVDFLAGGNMSIPRSVLRRISGFETGLDGTSSFEEADLSYRIRKEGLKLLYTNRSHIYHYPQRHGNRDVNNRFPTEFYRSRNHNQILFVLKNFPRVYLLTVIPFCVLRALYHYSKGRFSRKDVSYVLKGIRLGFETWKRIT